MSVRAIVSVARYWSTTFALWFDDVIAKNFSKRSRNWIKLVIPSSNTNQSASVWHAQVHTASIQMPHHTITHPPRDMSYSATRFNSLGYTTCTWQASHPSPIIVDIYIQIWTHLWKEHGSSDPAANLCHFLPTVRLAFLWNGINPGLITSMQVRKLAVSSLFLIVFAEIGRLKNLMDKQCASSQCYCDEPVAWDRDHRPYGQV